MTDFVIDGELAEELQEIAAKEDRPVKDVLRTMVDKYKVEARASEPKHKSKYPDWLPRTADSPDYDPLDDFIGMFDDVDATDLSIKATGHMGEYFVKKHDDPD
jgi:hypothetical protein